MLSIKPFEELRTTTSTVVAILNKAINVFIAFQCLPITEIHISKGRGVSKCKLPHHPTSGSILSLRYKDKVRGIICSSKRSFKHALTIDMSISSKNMNSKLYPKSIQLCGAKSTEDGIETTNLIVSHLTTLQERINKIRDFPNMFDDCLEWIRGATKGGEIEDGKNIINHNVTIPYHLDSDLINFLLNLMFGFVYHDEAMKKLEMMRSCPDVIIDHFYELQQYYQADPTMFEKCYQWKRLNSRGEPMDNKHTIIHNKRIPKTLNKDILEAMSHLMDVNIYYEDGIKCVQEVMIKPMIKNYDLQVTGIKTVMLNFNYPLGFSIDKYAFNEAFNMKHGFFARYENSANNNVTIELPYEATRTPFIKKKKNKVPKITFLVYKSGSVTLSGPNTDSPIMEDTYYKFMNVLAELGDVIKA